MAFAKLIEHSLASAGSKPDCIFLTGGASAAKGVVAVLQSLLPDVPLIRGDRFGSVGKGLCSIAARILARRNNTGRRCLGDKNDNSAAALAKYATKALF